MIKNKYTKMGEKDKINYKMVNWNPAADVQPLLHLQGEM